MRRRRRRCRSIKSILKSKLKKYIKCSVKLLANNWRIIAPLVPIISVVAGTLIGTLF